jgi:hypothetical protein
MRAHESEDREPSFLARDLDQRDERLWHDEAARIV